MDSTKERRQTVSDTILNVRTVVRDRLQEVGARFWSDSQLNRALYEGAKRIATRAECLVDTFPIFTNPNQQAYPLPFDGIRVHKMDFQPVGQSTQTYPIRPCTLYEADNYWGVWRQSPSTYPEIFVTVGFPPGAAATLTAPNASTSSNWMVKFWPVPSQPGTVTVVYYRTPKALTGADTDILEVPNGFEEALAKFAEYMALRMDKDPFWQSAKQEFEEVLETLIDRSRFGHDQSQSFVRDQGAVGMNWLYASSDWL